MSGVTLSANSNKWGSGLNLKTDFTWDESGFDDTITITVKTVMTLKPNYWLTVTPSVYVRVYQGVTPIQEIKNVTKVSYTSGSAAASFVLIDTTLTLSRGHDYCFEMEYSNAWISPTTNIGITTQTGYAFIDEAFDPGLACSIESVTRTGTDSIKQDITAAMKYSSQLEAPFTLNVVALESGGTTVLAQKTETTDACKTGTYSTTLTGLDKNKSYSIVCHAEQRGVSKSANETVTAWEPPAINDFKVIAGTHNSLTVQAEATSPQNDTLIYKYGITADINQMPDRVEGGNTHTFEGLDPASHYYICVDVNDTQKSFATATTSGITAPTPALTVTAYEVTAGGFVERAGALYYCAADDTLPQAVERIAVIKDGAVVTINT